MIIDLTTVKQTATDEILGNGDNNDIVADIDNAAVLGLGGDDTLHVTGNTNVVAGGIGNDNLQVAGVDNVISGGAGDDTITISSGNATIDAGSGNDRVTGSSSNDVIEAGSGNDYVVATAGNDVYTGGSGFDTLDFSNANSTSKIGIDIDISQHVAIGGGINASFDGFEKVIGSSFADTIKGSSGADVIDGGRGNDTIRSMAGADTLTGGKDHDTFVYFKKDVMLGDKHQGVDTITDFNNDTIDLRDFFKGKPGDINEAIHLTNSAEGTMVSAKMVSAEGATAYVDVVMLQYQHIAAEITVKSLASDGLFLV